MLSPSEFNIKQTNTVIIVRLLVMYCSNDMEVSVNFCRFVQYNPTSLEKAYKHELLTEHDLGVTIDLINPDTYKIDPNCEFLYTCVENCILEKLSIFDFVFQLNFNVIEIFCSVP